MNIKGTTERGQALIIIAFAMIGLVAIVGLAIDGSAKFSDRRHAQNAADTAAMAAAFAKVESLSANQSNTPETCPPESGTPSVVCSALLTAGFFRANSNGYDNDITTNTVEIHSPPIGGPYAGNVKYVQVVITSTINTTFARVIGINQLTNVVEAVAYAHEGGSLFNGATFVSVNPEPICGNGSLYVGGDGTLNLYDGGFFVNSDVGCGYQQPNCTALTLNIFGDGGVMTAGSPINTCDSTLPQDTTQEQISLDEIDDTYPPVPSECSVPAAAYNDPPGSNTWHITPGAYNNFPQASINGDIVGNKKDIVMDPGIYCVNNDIKWSGVTFDSLDGTSGVTIYIRSGYTFNFNIDSPIVLNPGDEPGYEGYLIIVEGDRDNIENCNINGGSYITLNGTIFAPYCNITINGDNKTDSEINAQIVGWDLKINGGSEINIRYDPDYNAKNPKKVGLMK